jgi:pimeloyl-ACP methyl ester carboxylesterase
LVTALLPVLGLLAVGFCGAVGWLVATATRPPRHPYLVTPDKYFVPIKATEERWRNPDGTEARGWLLRGAEGGPAVVLLHSYGTDRSWLLNLGVKLSEATGATVLWPDLRGHGQDPPVATTTFGAREGADVAAAVAFLRALKTQGAARRPLAGPRLGVYGVELGAYAALRYSAQAEGAARPDALVLDSIPAAPDALLRAVIHERTGLTSPFVTALARFGTRLYFLGRYDNTPACALAARLPGTRALLLTGARPDDTYDATVALAPCFPAGAQIELLSALPLTGRNMASAPGEQGEAYDRRVIDYFDRTLRAADR